MVGIAAVRSEGSSGEPQRSTARATALGIMAALAGLMFGLDTGVVAGALPFIATDFHASDALQGWIVSSMMAGQHSALSPPVGFPAAMAGQEPCSWLRFCSL